MTSKRQRILILGGGPAGLAAGLRLQERGDADWAVLEAEPEAGGLCRSLVDRAGFVWDLGGHVFFSSWPRFAELMEAHAASGMGRRLRRAEVSFGGRRVPFPFQGHYQLLPPELAGPMGRDLAAAPGPRPGANFADWCVDVYGRSMAEAFFLPFNAKLWQTPLELMSSGWVGQRVAPPRGQAAWGPNNVYFYPAAGGTGQPFRGMAQRLGAGLWLGARVAAVDAVARRASLADGRELAYDGLVSTIALDDLAAMLRPALPPELAGAAAELRHNSMWLVGLGFELPSPEAPAWLYFPEPEFVFSRVTNMAAHAPANLPEGDPAKHSAWLAEVPAAGASGLSADQLTAAVAEGLVRAGLTPPGARPVSVFRRYLAKAYPVPTLGRDAALAALHGHLARLGILSRGRFGGWIYEIGNMDHAMQMGMQAVDRLLDAGAEPLWDGQWASLKQWT